jgi:hypothetical protein
MIDVCPVGALTDKTFRFKSRVWFNKPFNAHRECTTPGCCGNNSMDVWRRNSATGRKDVYHEVEELSVTLVVLTTKIQQIGLLKDQENSIKTQLSTK